MTPLEIEYSPSSCIASIDAELRRYRDGSASARSLEHHRLATGPHPDQYVVVFPASGDVHLFIHGGYWQELSADDSLFAAPALVTTGVTYAAANYRLAPHASFDEMIDDCVAAVDVVAAALSPTRLTVSGSSAGAHLAAHVARLRPQLIDRLLLLSGVYDLRPLVSTYINDALGIDAAAADRWSVHGDRPVHDTLICFGEIETQAFKDQSARLAVAWGVPAVEVAGRNHFDLVHDLPAMHASSPAASSPDGMILPPGGAAPT